MRRTLCAIVILIATGACCTKINCPCEVLTLRIQLNPGDVYSNAEENAFYVVALDKEYKAVDSLSAIFSDRSFEVYDGMLSSLPAIQDYNFIVKNKITRQRDTISGITFTPADSVFECNDCFLKKDIVRCKSLNSKQLTHNGEKINSYTIIIRK